jgi:hypothetical protein
MSKPKSHTADIDVTCSALWHRLNAPAAILRLMSVLARSDWTAGWE